jgi:hypothetical protein
MPRRSRAAREEISPSEICIQISDTHMRQIQEPSSRQLFRGRELFAARSQQPVANSVPNSQPSPVLAVSDKHVERLCATALSRARGRSQRMHIKRIATVGWNISVRSRRGAAVQQPSSARRRRRSEAPNFLPRPSTSETAAHRPIHRNSDEPTSSKWSDSGP